MTTRRIIGLCFVLGIVCIAFLSISGSAGFVYSCTKAGNCPDGKACYTLCQFFGYKDFGGLCIEDKNQCCCVKDDGPGHP
ncbi:hypothetical protein AAZX31_04G215100 [Glycine max]|uniref:LCR n=2 Tax=Glycine subgen. Soja TaxID=1462606 RepID=I1JYQ1_SOYBN|nr:hypothetical protein GYH30_010868 [Glycine max]KHN19507.1 hypothetical protein glysoja_027764 [Glycine soja]KRH64405.1 hypothetical protein GLYMA_04G234200v4 [Glycine max]RZC17992.1 hypothetical protein D0Y65_010608 [Glycine soja]